MTDCATASPKKPLQISGGFSSSAGYFGSVIAREGSPIGALTSGPVFGGSGGITPKDVTELAQQKAHEFPELKTDKKYQ